MQKKSDPHIFSGMQRDMSISKQKPESLYDAKNLRFTARDGDTMLSITNERGTIHFPDFTMHGNYLGHCVVDDYIIVFTNSQEKDDGTENGHYVYIDRIYKIIPELPYGSTEQQFQELYKGNLNFSGHIETLGVYENDDIQKVYWTDGINQPRYIVCSKYGIEKITQSDSSLPNYSPNSDSQFDFVPTLNLNEVINVSRREGSGSFAPGTIQYAFTYYNKYGRQSNIFYTTPLFYISYPNRGGSPEDTITNTFVIEIQNIQKADFDYIRVYAIHRTSLDAVPTARRVFDLELATLSGTTGYITDNGIIGNTIDPTELLYMGGENIVSDTMTQKDNTLFFGNLELTRLPISDNLKGLIKQSKTITPYSVTTSPIYGGGNPYYDYYCYYYDTPGFKSGEHYKLGIQFQHKNGKWSEPLILGDSNYTVPTIARNILNYNHKIGLSCTFSISDYLDELSNSGYVKYREICVIPTLSDRLVLTQGLLNPTVFSYRDRNTGSPFAQSSWFFRPNPTSEDNNIGYQYKHTGVILNEIYGSDFISSYPPSIYSNNYDASFGVDQSIVTMHSPEVQFDDSFYSIEQRDLKLRLVGIANLGAQIYACNVQTSTPGYTRSSMDVGTKFKGINKISDSANIQATFSHKDNVIFIKDANTNEYAALKDGSNGTNGDMIEKDFLLLPWHKSGSLNNDNNRPQEGGTATSILKNKKLSSLKYFHTSNYFDTDYNIDINKVSLFADDQVSLLKIPYLPKSKRLQSVTYYGNVDTMIGFKSDSVLLSDGTREYFPCTYNSADHDEQLLSTRIKYKSDKHLVFSLAPTVYGDASVLPILNGTPGLPASMAIPFWETGENIVTPDTNEIGTYGDYTVKVVPYMGTTDPSTITNQNAASLGYNDMFNTNGTYVMKGVYVWKHEVEGSIVYQMWSVATGNQVLAADHYDVEDTIFIYFYPGQNGNYLTLWSEPGEDGSIMHVGGYPQDYTGPQSGFTPPATNSRQTRLNITPRYPYLFIAELYRDATPQVDFGGNNTSNLWIPAGNPKFIPNNGVLELRYIHGDTWYQRYDCLKTYAFTREDENSIIEIGSFLCETRVNLDGRYDRNRGETDNTVMSPINFNLLNPVYSQHNNFFNYRILDKDFYKLNKFSNQITWSKEKQMSADVDLWTNITMANTFDLDGTMGPINALRTWQDTIYCFQDNAISIISFNPRVQIPTSDGVPIEISNSYKLEGKVYISTSIGCKNKWTIAVTPSGVYFIDPNSKELYNLAGNQLSSISGSHGFSNWFKQNKLDAVFYDKNRNDLYILNTSNCIVYSEILGQFTSFMDYNNVSAMFNINDHFFAFKNRFVNMAIVPHKEEMFELGVGLYNDFFGTWQKDTNQEDVYVPEFKPYWLEFISNQDSALDKIYSTVDMRVDFTDCDDDNPGLTNDFFDVIQVANEYQDTTPVSIFQTNKRPYASKKFRIWRVEIPRDKDDELERIRNTWSKIKFSKTTALENIKMELHDLSVQYFI